MTLINNINKETITITAELKLDGSIEQFNQREVFVTFKDHKVNLKNDPTYIDPSPLSLPFLKGGIDFL